MKPDTDPTQDRVVLQTVPTQAEATIIVGLLRAYDIAAFASADDAGGTYPGIRGVRILVDSADEEQAREVLQEVTHAPAEEFEQPDPAG